MKGVLLAAGEGKRMKPISEGIQKVMIPILDKPLLQYALENLRDAEIREVLLVISPRGTKIGEHFGDGKQLGMDLKYVVQDEQLGPAHAISCCKNLLASHEYFIVQYGDSLAQVNLPKETLSRFQSQENGLDAFLTVRTVTDPSRYGIVAFNSRGNVREITEKPTQIRPGSLAAVGTYILRTNSFFSALREANFQKGKEMFPAGYILQRNREAKVKSWTYQGARVDVGNPFDLLLASRLTLVSLDRAMIDSSAELSEDVEVDSPVFIGGSCKIATGCRISRYSHIGEKSSLGKSTTIEESYVMGQSTIGERCKITRSILGMRSRVKDGEILTDSVIS